MVERSPDRDSWGGGGLESMVTKRFLAIVGLFAVAFAAWAVLAATPPPPAPLVPFPKIISGWQAEGKAEVYNRETIYTYMDGRGGGLP